MEIMVEGWCKKYLVVIEQIIIRSKGDNKMAHYFRVYLFVFVALLATSSLGGAELMNPDILSQSKVKKSSFKQILNDIKKTLPKELRKCSIVVTDIKLLKHENERVWEDWTIDICQETRVYYIDTFTPKGYYCTVMLKEEAFAKEKKNWDVVKKSGSLDLWINGNAFPHIDELKVLDQTEKNNQTSEKKSNKFP